LSGISTITITIIGELSVASDRAVWDLLSCCPNILNLNLKCNVTSDLMSTIITTQCETLNNLTFYNVSFTNQAHLLNAVKMENFPCLQSVTFQECSDLKRGDFKIFVKNLPSFIEIKWIKRGVI
jgi:hypothetical protein